VEGRSRGGVEGHDRLDQVDQVDPGNPGNLGMSSKKLYFDSRHTTGHLLVNLGF